VERLKLSGVTYLGGHPRHRKQISRVRLVVDRSGLRVRWLVLRLFSLEWSTVTTLDIVRFRLGNVPEALLGRHCYLSVGTDAFACRFYVPNLSADDLRAEFASWVSRAAANGAGTRRDTAAEPSRVPGDPLEVIRGALGTWRASSLGREPLPDRPTLAYRLAVAQNHLEVGNALAAVALLEPLAAQSAEAFGAADRDTLNVRNALAQAYQESGRPAEAVSLYEQNLADSERTAPTATRPSCSATTSRSPTR
jgi:hypothetical protein